MHRAHAMRGTPSIASAPLAATTASSSGPATSSSPHALSAKAPCSRSHWLMGHARCASSLLLLFDSCQSACWPPSRSQRAGGCASIGGCRTLWQAPAARQMKHRIWHAWTTAILWWRCDATAVLWWRCDAAARNQSRASHTPLPPRRCGGCCSEPTASRSGCCETPTAAAAAAAPQACSSLRACRASWARCTATSGCRPARCWQTGRQCALRRHLRCSARGWGRERWLAACLPAVAGEPACLAARLLVCAACRQTLLDEVRFDPEQLLADLYNLERAVSSLSAGRCACGVYRILHAPVRNVEHGVQAACGVCVCVGGGGLCLAPAC
jgi:hypothetical protein